MRPPPAAPAAPAPAVRRRDLWMAEALAAITIVAYGMFVPQGGSYDIDHLGYMQTVASMRKGEGFYQAFRASYLTRGVHLGGPRAFRTPYLFLFWREVPPNLLYPAFLLLVVGVTTFFLMRCTERPLIVLPVTVFLLYAGRTPGGIHGGREGWMLVELWAAPLMAVCTWAWKRDKWWVAALAATGGLLIRELMLPVVLVGLVLAWRQGKPVKPWLVGLGVAMVGWSVHIWFALQYGVAHGNEEKLFGTGGAPWTILYMLIFPAENKLALALAMVLWVLALIGLRRATHAIPPTAVLMALPVFGFFVNRPYWGLPIIPLVLLWGIDELVRRIAAARRHQPAADAAAEPEPEPLTDGGDAQPAQPAIA